MSDVAQTATGAATTPAPGPLRLLGGDAVVCEGDSCLVLPEASPQA